MKTNEFKLGMVHVSILLLLHSDINYIVSIVAKSLTYAKNLPYLRLRYKNGKKENVIMQCAMLTAS